VPGVLQDKGVAREFLQVLVDQGEGGGTIGEAILGART